MMYEGLRINFTMWHIVGGIYGYKKLIRLPRKQKKALKKSTYQHFFPSEYIFIKECPYPKKLPAFSYKQLDNEHRAQIEYCQDDVYTNS